ncbi:MAG: transcriptional repressor LexA [Candidatus Thiodiazotropha sp.]
MKLTRRQQEIYRILQQNLEHYQPAPTFDELCGLLGLKSRGSLHKHIQALVVAGLVEPMQGLKRGIRLVEPSTDEGIPYLGRIAAGRPIEAINQPELMQVPELLLGKGPCYVLQVSGDSMIDEGIYDGDYVVIEGQEQARDGDIVVALIDNEEATLKRIEQLPGEVILHAANPSMSALTFKPEQVRIQGVLRGLLRSYTK